MDAVEAVGGATGEFFAYAQVLGPAIVAALSGWLAGRNGRKVKIKVGEIEAEANSVKEIKELQQVLAQVGKIKHDKKPMD